MDFKNLATSSLAAGISNTAKGLDLLAVKAPQALGTAIGTAIAPKPAPQLVVIDKTHPAPAGYVPPASVGISPVQQQVQTLPHSPSPTAVAHSPNDLATLRNVLYAEISNRPEQKRQLESQVIINTAINRLKENQKTGRGPQTLVGILTQPNQYQGYGSHQYEVAESGQGDPQKLAAIDAVLKQYQAGALKDNTNGAYYYIHNHDGSITYDDTRPLY